MRRLHGGLGLALQACLLVGFVTVAPTQVMAQGSERQRIAQDRLAVGALHDEMELACQQRFAVTACVEDVRSRRREALAPLRERELRLEEADRSQRAADRRAAVAAKQQAALARPPLPEPVQVVPRLREAPAAAPPAALPDHDARAAAEDGSRAQEAARRVQAAQQRREAARATQERVAKRLAERESAKRRVVPLPVPGAASAAGTAGGRVPPQGSGAAPR